MPAEYVRFVERHKPDQPTAKSVFTDLQVRAGKGHRKTGGMMYEMYAEGGVTLGDLFDVARNPTCGWVRINHCLQRFDRISLDEIFEMIGTTDRRPGNLGSKYTVFGLHHIVIPSEEEWEAVK